MLKEQADIVIASTHIGHNPSNNATSSSEPLSSIKELDLVLGDHTLEEPAESDNNSCGWFSDPN